MRLNKAASTELIQKDHRVLWCQAHLRWSERRTYTLDVAGWVHGSACSLWQRWNEPFKLFWAKAVKSNICHGVGDGGRGVFKATGVIEMTIKIRYEKTFTVRFLYIRDIVHSIPDKIKLVLRRVFQIDYLRYSFYCLSGISLTCFASYFGSSPSIKEWIDSAA